MSEPKEFQGIDRSRLVWLVQRNRELADQARVQCERAQAERESWKRRALRAEGDVMAVDDVLAECLGVRLLAPGTLALLRRKLGQVVEAGAVMLMWLACLIAFLVGFVGMLTRALPNGGAVG